MNQPPPLPPRIAWFAPWTWSRRWQLLACTITLPIITYVLSWPFALEAGPKEMQFTPVVVVGMDPQSGNAILADEATIAYSPRTELYYRPLQYAAREIEVPAVSPVLRWYYGIVAEFLR
jgi:hypothetical protein